MTHTIDKADDDAVWARIDRALGDIEAALQKRAAPPDAALAARHAALRAAVVTAIGQIDALVEAQGEDTALVPLDDLLSGLVPANGQPA